MRGVTSAVYELSNADAKKGTQAYPLENLRGALDVANEGDDAHAALVGSFGDALKCMHQRIQLLVNKVPAPHFAT